MALFQKKRRYIALFLPLILILIFFSLTAQRVRRAPWYEEVFWNLLSGPQRLVSLIADGVAGAWGHYVALIGAKKENEILRKSLAELQGRFATARETEMENKRLRALLAYEESFPHRTLVARVIASDPRAEFKSITINRGFRDGIEPLMPVVAPRGVVGKVGKVAAHSSRVLLITDPNSAVDAMVQRSRARCMVVGAARRTALRPGYYLTRLEYLRRVSDIRNGDVVVTSGFDRIFPAGIPIGTVSDLRTTHFGVFKDAVVVPFENMAELQEVMVLLSKAGAESND